MFRGSMKSSYYEKNIILCFGMNVNVNLTLLDSYAAML
jgi:hypothetical protein